MGPTLLLAAALIGPDIPVSPESPAQWRAAFRSVMQRASVVQHPDPADAVPDLAAFYTALEQAKSLSASERSSLKGRVKVRLEQFRDDLQRVRRGAASSRGGGAVPPGALELIQLIQSTIEPDSWAMNGGHGTIWYWALTPALVVRQTGEVHQQLGSTLDALRK